MGTAMKVLVVLLSVVLFTYAAKITIDASKFRAVCRAHAGPLPDTNDLCERGLTALTNVEKNKNKANFNPYLNALGFVVPAHGAGPYNPLFFTAFDGQAGYKQNPYMLLLSQNADITDVWTSYNILPGAMMNDRQFRKIFPGFLIVTFWQQYSRWMALNTKKGVPSLWLTGGTEKGYFPPQHGRYPSFWESYELPNMQSDRVIIFHAPQKIVTGQRCNDDHQSYNRLHDTNRKVRYTCCELPPLSGDITKYGQTMYFNMAQIVQKIRNKEALPDTCVADLQQRFSQDKVEKKVNEAVGAIVDEAKVSLLARAYLYEWRGKRQLASMLSSAVCTYLKNKLEDIAGDGRLDFSEEDGNLIGSTSEGMTVRFTELLPSVFDAEFLGGLLLNSISYNCSSMKLSISTQIESLIIIPNILELSQVVLSFTATLGPSKEDLRLNALEFHAQWSVGGITGQFEITDDLDNSQLIIQGGPPDDSDVDLGALINNLAGEDVLDSSYALSDVRVRAIANMIEGGTVTVVVSGSFKQNTLYGIFQKTQDDSSAHYNAAFAADIDGAEFSELVKRVTGVDISGVPVLGSLSIPDIGITISTDEIRSPILTGIFSGESLLHISGDYISSGLTAYFNLNTDLGNVPVFISYSNKDFNFEFPTGFTFSFRSLLNLVPDLQSILNSVTLQAVTLPPGIKDLLDIEINDFSVDVESRAISIDATYPNTLTFFDQLTIDNLNVVIDAVLKSPRSITVEFSGQIGIADHIFDVQFNRNDDTGGYVLDVTIVTPPSLNDLLSLIPELGSLELPPGISDVLSLEVNKLSADFSTGAVTISASYPQPLTFLDGALTVQEASIVVVAVLKSPRSVSIEVTGQVSLGKSTFNIDVHRDSQTGKYVFDAKADGPVPLLSLVSLIPGLGSLSLPPGVSDILDLTINDFSVDLDSGRLDIVVAYPKKLSFLNDALTVEGITITINAMVKSPRSVSITVSGQIGIGGKVVGIVFSRNVKTGKYGIDATIDKPINFNDLLSLIPEVSSLPLPPGIDDVLNTEINDFSVDIDSGTVFIDATYPGTLTFFNQLTITNLNVVLNAVLKSPRSITVEFSGQIEIANQIFDVQFNRNDDTGGYVLDVTIVTPPSLNDLLSLIPELGSLELPPGISDVLSLEVNKLSADFSTGAVTISASYPQPLSFLDGALTVQEASIVVVAVLKSPRSVSIEVTGQVSLGETTFNIDIHRDSQTGKYVFDAKADGPVPLLSLVSLIPDLGSLSLPPGVSDILDLTINDFSVDLDSGALDIVVAYPRTLSFLNDLLTVEGVTITINAIVKSPRRVSVTVRGQIGIGGEVFEIVFSRSVKTGKYGIDATINRDITLNSLLSLIPEVSSLPLPPFLSDLLNLQIDDFSVDLDKLEVRVDAKYPGSISFFDDAVVVNNPGVVIHAIFKSPRRVSLEIVGDIEIGGEDFSISITQDRDSGKYVLIADIGRINIAKIVQEFGAAVVPDELSSIVDAAGFLQFAINDAHITYPFGGGTQQIQLSGQPEIAGINGPHMSAIVIRQGGSNELIQGFEIGKITISDLIKKISGFSVSSIAILNQQLEAAVLISPVTLPGVRLIGSKLSDFSINKGVSFQAAMGWPPDCSADPFCAVAQGAIGPDARFVLGGTIASAKSFTFSASVADLHLGSVLLAEAGLEVTVGVTTEIGVFGSVTIPNPGLTLTGAIRVGNRGVVLEMTMTGCWESAFGVKWITICSLQVVVSLKPGVPLAGFAFGGEVKLGDTSCGRQVQAQGFIGIDPVSPQENYYYVNFPGDFTIGSILKAFCLNLNLPKPVEESGFPRGFLSSFSLFGKELPHVPLSIPQGYRLKGTLNILGLEASADITVGLPDGIKMDVSLPALSLDKDLLAMYAKSSDQSRGPFLVANITLLPRPSVNVEASGYLSVLGISRGAILRITNDAYMFSITGKFLKLFDAYLEITASYGDINSASFRVRGGFKNDLFSRIAKMVDDAMKKSASQATAAIDSAQRKVQSAQRSFDAANNKLSSAQRSIDSAQRSFDDAVNKLRGAENTVRRLCNPPSCGNVCVPSPCGTTCVARAWGRCVLVRPTFSSCCFRAPDVPCQTRRAACIALRETATAALKVARQIVDKSRVTLDAAKGVLEGAKVAVNAARHSLDVAKAVLEAAKQTYKAGVEAASALTRFALNDLFNIKEITFDVKLSVANGGSFACRVSARILGKNVNVSLQFNVRNISLIAKQLADKAIGGLSSFFG